MDCTEASGVCCVVCVCVCVFVFAPARFSPVFPQPALAAELESHVEEMARASQEDAGLLRAIEAIDPSVYDSEGIVKIRG
jgi:hypothetical protein